MTLFLQQKSFIETSGDSHVYICYIYTEAAVWFILKALISVICFCLIFDKQKGIKINDTKRFEHESNRGSKCYHISLREPTRCEHL